jgi:hypothetical protein
MKDGTGGVTSATRPVAGLSTYGVRGSQARGRRLPDPNTRDTERIDTSCMFGVGVVRNGGDRH